MRGRLFTKEFLEQGIRDTPEWESISDAAVERLVAKLRTIIEAALRRRGLNEAVTEQEVILPTLRALGWVALLPQQTTSRRRRTDVPDLLLFASEDDKEQALAAPNEADRYPHAVLISESKRWQRPLDRTDGSAEEKAEGTPSTQILRYLSRADAVSNRRVTWAILTNGRLWRLYWQGAQSRSEEFFEIDLVACLGLDAAGADEELGDPWAKLFLALFRPQAFLPRPEDVEGRSFLVLAHADSRLWEARVSQELGTVVLDEVFPTLVRTLVERDRQAPHPPDAAYLEEARRSALTFLYRMLFVLFGEDRNLLPVTGRSYEDYSLRKLRSEVATKLDAGGSFSASATRCWARFADLSRAIAEGDPSIGVPAYDGGLFDLTAFPLLQRSSLPDSVFAPLLDRLSRREEGQRSAWITYRDLSVQHLGSVYEKLLERDVAVGPEGVTVRPNPYARRVTGSFFTHDDLVKVIVSRALSPHIEEFKQGFRDRLAEFRRGKRRGRAELEMLRALDPASKITSLAVCDPAMGSGHFLVALVDHLADEALQAIAEAESEARAAGLSRYRSPLAGRFDRTRQQILKHAEDQAWTVRPEQLDDRHLVRRIVLKRSVYGVDKNPMAVELAKVALWLHTFTVGAPLSFLDHHLRCGDSLFGEWVETVTRDLGPKLFLGGALAAVDTATILFERIAERDDADIADVDESKALFEQGQAQLEPLRSLFDFWQAARWLRTVRGAQHPGVTFLLGGYFGDMLDILVKGGLGDAKGDKGGAVEQTREALGDTGRIARQERFFHWELAFPGIWQKGGSRQGPGFDVVIGNPPWDRVKLQEVEWFAARRPEIAAAQRANDRKRMIEALRRSGDPLWREYDEVKKRAETAAQVARDCDQYPLLSGGDVNLYSLFVERAARLVNERGTVGLLTPSGIAADATAAPFFRGIATTGRLAALLDFENKKVFFPDIHASFKLCALVFGGSTRTFPEADCGFFLHSVAETNDPDRVFALGPSDFAAVNPNTGTAPVFRTRRDAEMTTAIYRRLPVLVDRRGSGLPKQAWPIRYLRMFDMTNDSGLFKTARELEKAGFYPVVGSRWRRGREEYVPLYEGKMVQMYDHRAASVVVHADNVHRPGQPEPASAEQHADPAWSPAPQFWVPAAEVRDQNAAGWALCFKEITASTNQRTMMAAIAPGVGFGNKVPLLLAQPRADEAYQAWAPLLLATLNSFVFDFVARQKVHGQTINLFILEQLPMVPKAAFACKIGRQAIGAFATDQVLHLSYTAEDLRPFAEDLGYAGDPFPWDEEDRRHRMARLDALFFQLYGIDRAAADYILNQFPIVRADDEREFSRFLTRDLILAYMNAMAAGDLSSVVQPR